MSARSRALADDGGARHLQRGRRMPDIELPTTAGRSVSFARLAGRAIVYCYPWTGRPGEPNPPGWDDIPGAHGSTPQAEGFRDLYDGFRQVEAQRVRALHAVDRLSARAGRAPRPAVRDA